MSEPTSEDLGRHEVDGHAHRHPNLARHIQTTFLRYLIAGGPDFADTVDGIYELIDIPPDVSPTVLGVVQLLARDGIIKSLAVVKSRRRINHGSYLNLWQIADQPAALRWLETHPDDSPPPLPQPTLFPPEPQSPAPGNTAVKLAQ